MINTNTNTSQKKKSANREPNPTNYSNARSHAYLKKPEVYAEKADPCEAESFLETNERCSEVNKIKTSTVPFQKNKAVELLELNKANLSLLENHSKTKSEPLIQIPKNMSDSMKDLFSSKIKDDKRCATERDKESFTPRTHRLEKLREKILKSMTETEFENSILKSLNTLQLEEILAKAEAEQAKQGSQGDLPPRPNANENKHGAIEATKNPKNEENKINLEDIIAIQEKIAGIVEGLKKSTDVATFCEEWWELTNSSPLSQLEKLFKEEEAKKGIKNSLILEVVVISLICVLSDDLKFSPTLLNFMKELIEYVHKNFLIIIDFIVHRLPPESVSNIWAKTLQSIISKSKIATLQKKDKINTINKNNEAIIATLKKICSGQKDTKKKGKGKITSLSIISNNKTLVLAISEIIDQISNITISQTRDLILESLEATVTLYSSVTSLDTQPQAPYLPPLSPEKQSKTYTLVLDLDETLVHYFQDEGQFLERPNAVKFLKEMSKLYEIVIFTASLQNYADWVLDQLDPKGYIKYRLYRHHALPYGPVYIKDLSKLGRDLSKMIIVDNIAENFQFQPHNGIHIRTWFDDMSDTALEELAPLLKEIVKKKVPDVREALKRFKQQLYEQLTRGVENPVLTLD